MPPGRIFESAHPRLAFSRFAQDLATARAAAPSAVEKKRLSMIASRIAATRDTTPPDCLPIQPVRPAFALVRLSDACLEDAPRMRPKRRRWPGRRPSPCIPCRCSVDRRSRAAWKAGFQSLFLLAWPIQTRPAASRQCEVAIPPISTGSHPNCRTSSAIRRVASASLPQRNMSPRTLPRSPRANLPGNPLPRCRTGTDLPCGAAAV